VGRDGCARAEHLLAEDSHFFAWLREFDEKPDRGSGVALCALSELLRQAAVHISAFSFPNFSFSPGRTSSRSIRRLFSGWPADLRFEMPLYASVVWRGDLRVPFPRDFD
jgi:hypothetical protein